MEKVKFSTGLGYFDVDVLLQLNNYIIDVLYTTTEEICPTATISERSSFELSFFCNGSGKIIYDNQEITIQPNTFLLVPPNTEYHIESNKSNPPKKYVVAFISHPLDTPKFTPDMQMYQTEFNELYKRITTGNIIYGYASASAQVEHTFKCIFKEFGNMSEMPNIKLSNVIEVSPYIIGSKYMLNLYFSELFINFLRANMAEQKYTSFQMNPSTPYWKIYSIEVIMLDDCKDLTMERLARRIHISTRQLSRYMQTYYHSTFKEMLNKTRILKTKYMLQTSDMTIEEISQEVGIKSKYYYIKKFKELLGMTPDEYREQSRKNEI